MTSQPAKSIASMSALVTQLNMSEPKNGLLAELPAEAQAYIAHDRIFWFEGLDKGNFDLDQFKVASTRATSTLISSKTCTQQTVNTIMSGSK